MESMGIISKVDEPSPWYTGMVVVPKKSGEYVYVNLKRLHESVLREVHSLPNVDKTIAQLTSAKCCSKLDANSGFRQTPLAKSSSVHSLLPPANTVSINCPLAFLVPQSTSRSRCPPSSVDSAE